MIGSCIFRFRGAGARVGYGVPMQISIGESSCVDQPFRGNKAINWILCLPTQPRHATRSIHHMPKPLPMTQLKKQAVDVVELKPPLATPSQATAELAKRTEPMARAAWLAEHAPPVPGGVEQLDKASKALVLWRCVPCEHEWFAFCDNRACRGQGCPACDVNSRSDRATKGALASHQSRRCSPISKRYTQSPSDLRKIGTPAAQRAIEAHHAPRRRARWSLA